LGLQIAVFLFYRRPGALHQRGFEPGAALAHAIGSTLAGTLVGLCGPLLKPFAARLVGVDLSVGMLVEAAKRELYDELVEAELGAYLTAHPSSFNIIVVLRHLGLFGIINPPGDREGGGQE
jgi:predicted TPR repeat methyltransferase